MRKNRRQIFYRTDRANEVNKTFIIAFGSFPSLFIALCSSSDVAVYRTSEFLGFASCLPALVRHSFASLIYKQLSGKATLMFQDVLLFELIQRTLPNPFLFHLNQLRNFPAKTYSSRTAPGRAIRFFPDLSATN